MAVVERARQPNEYRQHRPEQTELYRLVAEHLEGFLRETQLRYAKGLPRYVEREFRKYLECGIHAFGFLRARCKSCQTELLVAFSCKKRGVCPSCNARRMCNTAAHLTDRVLPRIPVRQWVLSVPFELRLLLAKNPSALSAVGRILVREVFRWQRERAHALGVRGPRGGAICFVQRFGGSLNLNVHFHVVIPDGVFRRERGESAAHFELLPPPSAHDLEDLALAVEARVLRWLERRRLIASQVFDLDDSEAPEPSALDACLSGSLGIGELVALKSSPELSDLSAPPKPQKSPRRGHARGFDIHAGVVVSARDTEGRERLLRYCARPPLSLERLRILPNGLVAYALRKPRGKQTHRVLTPLDFLARLAALVPPPRHPLVTFHGVFAPHSAWRRSVIPGVSNDVPEPAKCEPASEQSSAQASKLPNAALRDQQEPANESTVVDGGAAGSKAVATRQLPSLRASPAVSSRIDWAELLKRIYDIDALACPCGGRLSFIATILDPAVAQSILASLGMPSTPPPIARARSPDLFDDLPFDPQDW